MQMHGQIEAMAPAFEPRLLRIETDVCRITGLGRTRIRQEIDEGRLPVVRIGRSVRVDSRDLDAWIARNRVGGEAA